MNEWQKLFSKVERMIRAKLGRTGTKLAFVVAVVKCMIAQY
jgi:hypothetical protein